MSRRAPGGPTRDPLVALLRGGAVPGVLAGVVVVAVSAAWGSRAVAGAAVGAGVAVVALWAGPWLVGLAQRFVPAAALAVALAVYSITVSLLGAAFLLLAGRSWLSPTHVAAGLIAVTVIWMAGQVVAFRRLRLPAFDVPLPPPAPEQPGPGRPGGPGSSPSQSR